MRDHYKVMRKISRVSKTFHNLIDTTPSFWSLISAEHPSLLVQRALAKSMNAPLIVECPYLAAGASTNQFMTLLANQTHRLFSLNMLVNSGECEQTFLTSPAPLLEYLSLRSNARNHSKAIEIFAGNAPRLLDVVLNGVPLKMSGDTFSGLRSMELVDIDGHCPSIPQLIGIIAASPQMERLTLERINFPSGVSDPPPEHGQMELSRLKKLSLDLPTAALTTLLNHIRAPGCQQLRLQFGRSASPFFFGAAVDPYPTVAFEGSLEQFTPLLDSLHKSLPLTQTLRVCIGSTHASVVMPDININAYITNPYRIIEWLVSSVDMTSTRRRCQLELTLANPILGDIALFNWLGKMPCVTSLHVNAFHNAPVIFRYLSQPTITGTTARWPLPNLEELYVEDNDILPTEVLEMVKARYGKTAATPGDKIKKKGKGKAKGKVGGGSKDQNLPKPLILLDLSGIKEYEEDVYDELVELVGTDQVIWDAMDDEEDYSEEHSEEYHDYYDDSDNWDYPY